MKNILPWVALKTVPGIGNLLFKRLFQHFKTPESVLQAPHEELLQVEGMTSRLAHAVTRHGIPEKAKRDLGLALKKGYKIITLADSDYPPLLLEIPDPPPILYVCGHLKTSLLNIAIVGSRNATKYGLTITRRLGTDLATLGITVVSGMALGIDTAAHYGALAGHGNTIAVLGSGLERIYPASNKKLFYQIAEQGAVISEFPLETEPESHNFPQRNRIISGTCQGTVIVEATRRSGSLITARIAAEQNRDVFAVPGSIQSFKSTGSHALIKQGAKLVENAQDIVEEFDLILNPPAAVKTKSPKITLHLTSDESA
ncbi:MAG: DNA-protecting protein DprA, partial [Deltaproteobacteria bacterium]|nr:DNA-protecting protein DprA [Deltaproteobacteria bacterium]